MSLSWSDVGKAIAGVAPILGTALGGPAGAVVGSLVASALGTSSSPDAVNAAIAADPASAAKILQVQNEHEEALVKMQTDYQTNLDTQRGEVIQAEAKSDSWMASNWRPILMLTFTAIVAMNWLILPVVSWFGPHLVPLVLPPDMWDLLKIGVGGYIVGRSGEKITNIMKS
ncbi:MAG: 3TM-type holin [Hyphomicrobium sp.]|jgi:hypothetical protein